MISINAGTVLVRVYDPESTYKPGPRTFRRNGPRERFDHHRGTMKGAITAPTDDPDRSVYYAALTLSSAIVEVFGNDRTIERGTFRAVYSTVTEPVVVLDLRGNAAIRAGMNHAIGMIEDRAKTHAWSRHIYGDAATYGPVGGLIYANSHNGEDAILLYERAQSAIATSTQRVRRLAALDMELELLRIAGATGFPLI
jgi:hypothetical protein